MDRYLGRSRQLHRAIHVALDLKKQDTMIMSYSCEENEKDRREHHLPEQ